MTLFDLQKAIIDGLRESFEKPIVADIRGHRGQFESATEVKKVSLKKTALLVAYRGFEDCKKACGDIQADINWVVYVVTEDAGNNARDQVAAAIVSLLLPKICGKTWGVANENPKDIRGRNVTSTEIDRMGICVWAITWQQAMPIGSFEELALYDWLTTEIDTDLTPADESDEPQMQALIDMTQPAN